MKGNVAVKDSPVSVLAFAQPMDILRRCASRKAQQRRSSSMAEHRFRKAGVVGSTPIFGFFSPSLPVTVICCLSSSFTRVNAVSDGRSWLPFGAEQYPIDVD